jgi:hypothetical protein
MLTGDQVRGLLAIVDDGVAIQVLALLAETPCLVYEAERLLLASLPTDQRDLGNQVIATLVRDRVRREAAC